MWDRGQLLLLCTPQAVWLSVHISVHNANLLAPQLGLEHEDSLGSSYSDLWELRVWSQEEDEEANKLIEDAKILEAAGCFAVVLEKIPRELAKKVSEAIEIPTIGIGAGPDCDGQVLVLHDLLGITMDFSPRFLRRYLNLADEIDGAIKQYCDDVRQGDFPNESESYTSQTNTIDK